MKDRYQAMNIQIVDGTIKQQPPPNQDDYNITAANDRLGRGARYLTGENLEVVWAEFLTLS